MNSKSQLKLQFLALQGLPILDLNPTTDKNAPDRKFLELLHFGLGSSEETLEPHDIIVISHTFLAKIYSHIRNSETLVISTEAKLLAERMKKAPAITQLILEESQTILQNSHVLVTENHAGVVGTNAGIDKSNIPGANNYAIIPPNLDAIATSLHETLSNHFHIPIGVVITDSVGRPFRLGSIGIAIGASGFPTFARSKDAQDLYEYHLKSTEIAIADMIASGADFLMGQGNEGLPIIICRGAGQIFQNFNLSQKYVMEFGAKTLQRNPKKDLFRFPGFLQVVESRYSHKSPYQSECISKEIIRECLRIAALAPNAHHSQPWRYISLDTPETRKTVVEIMSKLWENDMRAQNVSEVIRISKIEASKERFLSAPHLMLVVLATEDLSFSGNSSETLKMNEEILGIQSVAASITLFLEALTSHHLAGCWYSAGLFAHSVISRALSLPVSWKCQALITFGKPEFSKVFLTNPKARRNLDEIYIEK